MTTTAHEDQFTAGTQTIQPVLQPYSTEAILRRNIASLEVALRTQTERAEAAETELAKLAQQKPVAWMREDGNLYLAWQKDLCLPEVRFSPLYAVPAPAPAVPDADAVARFEQWVLAQADARPHLKGMRGTLCNKYPDGSYHTLWVDMAWEGWKARALLQSADRMLEGGE